MRWLALILLPALILGGCASAPQSAALRASPPAGLDRPVLIEPMPFFPQDRYQCGPAALATMLAATGLEVLPEDLVPLVYVPERKGSFQVEMLAAARRHGRLAYPLDPRLEALLREIRAGHPVLVLQNLGLDWYPQWHFAVVKGFDLGAETLVLNSGTRENYRLALDTFERTWARGGHWAALVLEPGELPAGGEPGAYFRALVDLERQHPALGLHGYAAAIARWPRDEELRLGYANALYGAGEHAPAERQLRALIAQSAGFAPAYNNLAQILFEQGRLEEAAALAEQAVALGGDYIEAYRGTLRAIRSAGSRRE